MMKYCTSLRKTSLPIQLFNTVFRPLIFLLKITTLSICITGFAFSLKLVTHSETWLVGAVCGSLGVISFSAFAVVYEQSFRIPEGIQQLQEAIALQSCLALRAKKERLHVNQMLVSLRHGKIEVGDFHVLQRISIALYANFCLVSVCNLVVAFPGKL